MSEIFQVPAYITEVKATANGSLKIKAETMESLSGDAMQRFFAQIDKPGYLCFAARQIETTDLLDIPMPKSDKKTKSQKLRAVIFQLWNQNDMGKKEFEDFYGWYMDHITNKVKGKLA
jgi:hypothetical protein